MDALTTDPARPRELPGRGDLRLLAGPGPDGPGARALQEAVIAAFPEYRLDVYFAERSGVLEGADHVVVARPRTGDRLLGLVVARERRCAIGRYLHVEMNLITADHQRRGLLAPLWRVMLDRLLAGPGGFPPVIALKTYNPMVYSTLAIVARLSGADLYPAPASLRGGGRPAVPDVSLTGLATAVAADVASGLPFDPATGVVREAGTPRDFYPSLPETNKRAVQAYFARHLEPGDRLLCLLRFGRGTDLRRIARRLGAERRDPAPAHDSAHDPLSQEARAHA